MNRPYKGKLLKILGFLPQGVRGHAATVLY
jgi:hypothetical protein